MLGFNFVNFVDTNSYHNIPQLTDEDFMKIADLILRVPDTRLIGNAQYFGPKVLLTKTIKRRKKPKK